MNVSSCSSINSLIMHNMEIMIKISFAIILMLTAIIGFDCFQMSFVNARNNVQVYQGHINFRKEVSKSSQPAG